MVEASSSEQRLQAVNVTKPVVPLKSIQFLQLNGRSSRGFHGRSPVEEGNVEGSTSKEKDHGTGSVSKFTIQQQLTRGDQQLKERQRLINQQNNNNLRILSANLVNLNPNASSSLSKQAQRRGTEQSGAGGAGANDGAAASSATAATATVPCGAGPANVRPGGVSLNGGISKIKIIRKKSRSPESVGQMSG